MNNLLRVIWWPLAWKFRRRRVSHGAVVRGVRVTVGVAVSTSVLMNSGAVFADVADVAGSAESAPYFSALESPVAPAVVSADESGTLQFVSLRVLQDAAPLQPLPSLPVGPTTGAGQSLESQRAFASVFRGGIPRSTLPSMQTAPFEIQPQPQIAADRILGIESRARSTSDVGSLLSKSARNRSVVTQKRNPIITDPRIRGSRVGQTGASGSYWLPARIDLDTALSKIDSRLVSSVDVVKGPYAVQYGPGTEFMNFELLSSPRSAVGPEMSGSTSLDYQTNGEQWYGRQTLSYADADWGARVGYGHRTGSDYRSGDGEQIPSSYQSRDFDVAVGYDVSPGQVVEVFYLNQTQTDLELPGQAFDLDSLTTNAFEVTWINEEVDWADRLEVESWYNTTELQGNAQSGAKRRTFPFLNALRFNGVTDVESDSVGARSQAVWELDDERLLKAGVDVRVVRQELNEISSGVFGFSVWNNRNSPLPSSASVNPGLFLELTDESIDGVKLSSGVRADVVATEVLADTASIQGLGTAPLGLSLADILGTSEFDQSFGLWSAFVAADVAMDEHWTLHAAAGHGMRAPSLTELYVAESFMFLLQSGLNTVTGDPRLNPERRWQIDLGADYADDNFRMSANGFHAWVHDRITFENIGAISGPPFGQLEQVNLKYVNTDRATLLGFEGDAEYFLADGLSVFGSVMYVRGTDETRHGSFATLQAGSSFTTVNPSTRDPNQTRGAVGARDANLGALPSNEALPGISPLESRLGARLNGELGGVSWNVELATRIVDSQDRVARSLLESTTAGFTTYDVRSFWQLSDNLTVVAGVENLTDKAYREHFDFRSLNGQSVQQPGRNFYFGTELKY